MEDQISITLPEENPVPDKVEVKISESNKPERIITTFTINSEPKIISENTEATSQ